MESDLQINAGFPAPLRVCLSLFAAIIFSLVPSCSGEKMPPPNIQGVWVPDGSSKSWIKSAADVSKCQINLQAGGLFVGAVPDYLMDTFDRCAGKLMVGKGAWLVSGSYPGANLMLTFTELDGKAVNWGAKGIHIEGKGESCKLRFWFAGETEQFAFVRASKAQDTGKGECLGSERRQSVAGDKGDREQLEQRQLVRIDALAPRPEQPPQQHVEAVLQVLDGRKKRGHH